MPRTREKLLLVVLRTISRKCDDGRAAQRPRSPFSAFLCKLRGESSVRCGRLDRQEKIASTDWLAESGEFGFLPTTIE